MKITATAFKWMADGEGEWLMIRSPKAKQMLGTITDGKAYDVEVKEHRNRRSLDANALTWCIIGKLSEAVDLPPEEIYRSYVREIGGNYEIVPVKNEAVQKFCEAWQRNGLGWQTDTFPSKIKGYTNVRCFYGSSAYDTKQMSRLIDLVMQDAESVGIPTASPDEIKDAMDRWGA